MGRRASRNHVLSLERVELEKRDRILRHSREFDPRLFKLTLARSPELMTPHIRPN